MNPIRWPCDWNRPLSKEELAIARRLDRAPKDEEDIPPKVERPKIRKHRSSPTIRTHRIKP